MTSLGTLRAYWDPDESDFTGDDIQMKSSIILFDGLTGAEAQ